MQDRVAKSDGLTDLNFDPVLPSRTWVSNHHLPELMRVVHEKISVCLKAVGASILNSPYRCWSCRVEDDIPLCPPSPHSGGAVFYSWQAPSGKTLKCSVMV